MTFLPIVERELRVASRRPATHWMRFFAALLVIVVGFILLIGAAHSTPPHRLAQNVFRATNLIGFAFCLLAGTFLTADCLCSERREGTLGLLFLTDLRGYDVVLGKLAATSAVAAYAVLAILPMLGLPLLMGGVTPGEFGRMCLALLVTLLVSLASGLLMSAVCRDTRAAMLGSFCIMLALTAGLFLVGWSVWFVTRSNPVSSIMLFSPLGAYISAYDAGMMTLAIYWKSIIALSSLALAQLAAASWWLPRVWQRSKIEATGPARGKDALALVPRRCSAFGNPFVWLVTRDHFPGWATRLVLSILFLIWAGIFVASYLVRRAMQEECVVTCVFMAFGLHLIVKGLIAVQASRRFSEDRASGAMELLLATPLRPESILGGQWQALRRQFAPLLVVLTVMNVLLVIRFMLPGRMSVNAEAFFTFSTMFLGGIVLLFVDFRALGWAGMSLGLFGLRHHRAVLGALLRVMVAPWAVLFLFIFLAAMARAGSGTVTFCFVIWAGASMAMALVQSFRCQSMLTMHFRQLAAGDALRPPQPPWGKPPRAWSAPPPAAAPASRLRL